MTAEIFVAFACIASSCQPTTCRQQSCVYETAQECQRIADLFNNGNLGGAVTWKCFKKTVPVWEPVR